MRNAGYGLLVGMLASGVLPAPSAPDAVDREGRTAGSPALFPGVEPDSAALVRRARDAQARFVRRQVSRAPFAATWSGGRCDESFGRLCLRFGAPEPDPDPWRIDWEPPGEHEEVIEERRELIRVLDEVHRSIPGDAWVAGQLVIHLGEAEEWEGARAAAGTCRSHRPGWCRALEGYALHGLGDPAGAMERFEEALAEMDPALRREWLDPEWIVEWDLRDALRSTRGAERDALVDRIWKISDPWFSTGHHELQLQHFARRTNAAAREGSRSPHGMRWGDDLTQYVVRFGPEAGYRRIRSQSIRMEDPTVSGYLHPDMRHLLPGAGAVLEPAADRPGPEGRPRAFTTEQRVARSLHHAGETRRIRDLTAQVARFARGDSALVAAAWEYPLPPAGHEYWDLVRADSLPPPLPHDPDPVLMLLPWEAVPAQEGAVRARPIAAGTRSPSSPSGPDTSGAGGGHLLGVVPSGLHVVSIEVREPARERGWRYRQVMDLPRGDDDFTLSDLLVVRSDPAEGGAGPAPPDSESLERLVDRAYPSLRVPRRPVDLVWEVYGVDASIRQLSFALRLERTDRGFLRRAGEALGILGRTPALRIEWEEGVEEVPPGRPLLRRLSLDLSGSEPGFHHLQLEMIRPDGQVEDRSLVIEIVEAATSGG